MSKVKTIPSAGEDAEHPEHSHTASGNATWPSQSESQLSSFLKLEHPLTYDPAIPLLGTYPKDMQSVFT